MSAMQAAVLPRTRAADDADDHAGHYAGISADAPARSRPDLRLVHRAGSSVTLPTVTLPSVTLPTVTLPPAAQSPSRQPATPLRLTKRGRVAVAALAALLVVVLSLIAAGAAQAISHAGSPHLAGSNPAQVVVRPGQSLWSVAETADPNADTRLVIQQIIQLNSLNGDTVFAGQRLWVPRA